MKRVLVIDAGGPGPFCLSVADGALTIGESPEHAEVALRDLHILRVHCEVEIVEDEVVVSAPAAAMHVGAGEAPERYELHSGEEIHIGHAHLRLDPAEEDVDAGPAMDETLPDRLDRTPAPAPLSGVRLAAALTASRKQLLVIDGADHKQMFRLPETGSVSIGNSGKHADICLHDLYVSRVHCRLETQGDKVLVTHSEGKNGTLVNGERITQPRELRPGDILRVGNSHLRLEIAGGPERPAGSAPLTRDSSAQAAPGAPHASGAGEAKPRPGGDSPAQADAPAGLEGQVLGHYRLGPLLGCGHSGRVFRAQDIKTNQVVALKVLAPEFPANSAELQKLGQALKAATPLQHVNLVNILGAGKNGPHTWIAREHVDGESVDCLVSRLKEEGKLNWIRGVRVAVHLANALAYLHEQKAVHGNITPRNVLVSSGDKVTKLADLMLTKALEGSRLQRAVLEKKFLAELPYLAPEQVEPDAFVDHLADLYALGAVVYTLATGELPFTGDSPEEVIGKIRETPVARPTRYQRKMPFPFEGVVLKLLAKRQEDRYQTASELLADLDVLAHDNQIKV
ncbi:MAG TPA: FHA domain-containing serine/threonine-protein kinase [Gemmataceae bacterium]|nr:FHA domain-containing serine/threonine-protein kinase [Gemmataceae bacterium]